MLARRVACVAGRGLGRGVGRAWASSGVEGAEKAAIPRIRGRELRLAALQVGLPAVCFGFMDNFVMLVAGEEIDEVFLRFGLSTMAAAALGNLVSDMVGVSSEGVIERRVALPTPSVTEQQRTLRSFKVATNMGKLVGIAVGCVLGMVPLFLSMPEWVHEQMDELKRFLGVSPLSDQAVAMRTARSAQASTALASQAHFLGAHAALLFLKDTNSPHQLHLLDHNIPDDDHENAELGRGGGGEGGGGGGGGGGHGVEQAQDAMHTKEMRDAGEEGERVEGKEDGNVVMTTTTTTKKKKKPFLYFDIKDQKTVVLKLDKAHLISTTSNPSSTPNSEAVIREMVQHCILSASPQLRRWIYKPSPNTTTPTPSDSSSPLSLSDFRTLEVVREEEEGEGGVGKGRLSGEKVMERVGRILEATQKYITGEASTSSPSSSSSSSPHPPSPPSPPSSSSGGMMHAYVHPVMGGGDGEEVVGVVSLVGIGEERRDAITLDASSNEQLAQSLAQTILSSSSFSSSGSFHIDEQGMQWRSSLHSGGRREGKVVGKKAVEGGKEEVGGVEKSENGLGIAGLEGAGWVADVGLEFGGEDIVVANHSMRCVPWWESGHQGMETRLAAISSTVAQAHASIREIEPKKEDLVEGSGFDVQEAIKAVRANAATPVLPATPTEKRPGFTSRFRIGAAQA